MSAVPDEVDPALVKHRQNLLRKLAADERNPVLAELAEELLAGRATPTGVLASGVYDEALAPGVQSFTSWYSAASDQERQAAAERGAEILAEPTDDQPVITPRRTVRPRLAPNDDFSERTYLRE